MTTKFVIVNEAPRELKKNEYLIDKPSFLNEIELHRSKLPKNNLTAPFFMRMILDSIAQKYDPENMTAYSVKVHKYEGRPFTSTKSLNNIFLEMLKTEYPIIFEKYLDYQIRNRPYGTNIIYYVPSRIKEMYEIFYKHGVDELVEEKPTKDKQANKNTTKEKSDI